MIEDEFRYDLPSELIAKKPAEPRDSARLFVFDTLSGKIKFDHFVNLKKFLPKDCLLVLNDTKVVPARINLRKKSGGKVEVLFLMNEWAGGDSPIQAMVDRKVDLGEELFFEGNQEYKLRAIEQKEHIFSFKLLFDSTKIFDLLDKCGKTPIPKYIKDVDLKESELRQRYQTIFAKNPFSVAAPTASLHFTDKVLKSLEKKSIKKVFVTLNVGLGTFAPLSSNNFKENKLHKEFYEISMDSNCQIKHAIENNQKIIAVGTTVARTLESASSKISDINFKGKVFGETEIFIYPPFEFKIVDCLITNFHLPGSSLMMLVEAFLQYKNSKKSLVELYKVAIEEKLRFYSFGDVMLIK